MYLFEKYKVFFITGGLVLFIALIFVSYTLIEESPTEESAIETTTEVQQNFFVDVKGAVREPGVYEFSYGDRVIDAIEKAGGLRSRANTSNINLSQRLTSEMVVYVFTDAQIREGSSRSINCSTVCENIVLDVNNCYPNNNVDKININTAPLEQLITLSGIGESRALAIIAHREQSGPFETIEDIKQISGIGESIFNNIRDRITV